MTCDKSKYASVIVQKQFWDGSCDQCYIRTFTIFWQWCIYSQPSWVWKVLCLIPVSFARKVMLFTKCYTRERDRDEDQNHHTIFTLPFIFTGTFHAREKLTCVLEFIRSQLINDWQPFVLTEAGGHKLSDENVSLAELKLVSIFWIDECDQWINTNILEVNYMFVVHVCIFI